MRSTSSKVLPWRKQIMLEAVHHDHIVPPVDGLFYPVVRPDEPLWYIAKSPPFASLPSPSATLDETVLPFEEISHWSSSSSSSFVTPTGDELVMMQDGHSPQVNNYWSENDTASSTTFVVPTTTTATTCSPNEVNPGTILSDDGRQQKRRRSSHESTSEAITQPTKPVHPTIERSYHREKLNQALDDLRYTLASTEAFGREPSSDHRLLFPAGLRESEICWRHRSDLVRDAIAYIQMADVEIRSLRAERMLWGRGEQEQEQTNTAPSLML
jgi:hypothetical protein